MDTPTIGRGAGVEVPSGQFGAFGEAGQPETARRQMRTMPAEQWTSTADVTLLAVGLAASAALGVWRGRTIAVWQEADGTWWRQGSRTTLMLWGVLLVVRVILVGVDHLVGHPDASNVGAMLCTLAVSFAAQNAIVGLRMTGSGTRPAPALGSDSR
ncbi:hypothetical protein ACFHYQ_19150 [Sphaerimonospora cavernae]|uniref:DUF4328 domain-containing protein n=1 Tax=Sphaerimonospora cavernae TaxID=1740611 RepID=A0ABV6U8K2_9ACTN